jgi:hypothetical protein
MFRHRLSQKTLEQTIQIFGAAIPIAAFQALPPPGQPRLRERLFTPWITFWSFLFQVLGEASCRRAVQQVQAFCAVTRQTAPVSDTSAYCQARARLSIKTLQITFAQTLTNLEEQIQPEHLWQNRRVRVVDSTSASMPDTAKNQAAYPQPSRQKPGCGFPVVKIGALFSLATGAMLTFALFRLGVHDSLVLRCLWEHLTAGDVILGDRAFCSFLAIYRLQQQGVDVVFRLHQARLVDFRKGTRLGKNDHLITWKKPRQPPPTMSPEDFASLPPEILLREVRFSIPIRGFRTTVVTLVTTLLDPMAYPPEALAQLFRLRWKIELSFRDLKTTLGMEVLSCLSPAMIQKEIFMFFIAHNLVRQLMWQAAATHRLHIAELSFKGTLDSIQSWTWTFFATRPHSRPSRVRFRLLLQIIAHDRLPDRPNRTEPRVLKRRLKPFQLLTKPRHLMKEVQHRGKYRKPLS